MLVYRVETDRGTGPYTMMDYDVSRSCYDKVRNPDTYGDTKLKRRNQTWNEKHYFGFRSIAALMRWFHIEERLTMKEWVGAGSGDGSHIGVSVYCVPPRLVVMGSKQLGFDKHRAVLIERRDILDPTIVVEKFL